MTEGVARGQGDERGGGERRGQGDRPVAGSAHLGLLAGHGLHGGVLGDLPSGAAEKKALGVQVVGLPEDVGEVLQVKRAAAVDQLADRNVRHETALALAEGVVLEAEDGVCDLEGLHLDLIQGLLRGTVVCHTMGS